MIDLTPDESAGAPTPFTRMADHAAQMPDADALVIDDRTLSWSAFVHGVDSLASQLHALGARTGDRAALLSSVTPESATAFFGAARAGVSVAPLPLLISDDALARMMEDSGAKVVFCNAAQRARVETIIDGLGERAPAITIGLGFDDARWRAMATEPAGAPPPTPDPAVEFNLVYSSGTTGVPKGIKMSHAFRYTQCRGFSASLGMTPGGAAFIDIPLYSNYCQVVLLFSVFAGSTFVAHSKFETTRWLEDFGRLVRPGSAVFLVPAQYQRLLNDPQLDAVVATRPATKFCSGAPWTAEEKAELMRRWPGEYVEVYGMSEGAPNTVLSGRQTPDKLHTVGQCVGGGELKIIGPEGRELPQGETGEIVGRTGTMMDGYNNRPDADAELIWRDADGQVFFRSGDVGALDEDGFLVISGRLKDVIISGGFNIYSIDLERVLEQHPDVLEAAVVGLPDPRWGETPFGVVAPVQGARIEEAELLAWANERLGKVQRLSGLAIQDALPRGTLDKILRRKLRDQYAVRRHPAREDAG